MKVNLETPIWHSLKFVKGMITKTAQETMVTRSIDGMTASGGVELVVAKNHMIDHLLSDYEAAVTYMSNKVTAIFPPNAGGNHSRNASQAQGENKKSGLEHRQMNGRSVPFFNGVNASNPTWYFSDKEMRKLSNEGVTYIYSKRDHGGGRGGGRGGRFGRGGGRGGHNRENMRD